MAKVELKEDINWTRLDATPLPSPEAKEGFFGAYYGKFGDTKHGVIVFRGSEDFYDGIWHDTKLAVGEWPKAFKHAMDFYYYIIAAYNPEYLTFAGHSLGGALAQLVAHKVNTDEKNPPHRQKLAVCFNAPQMGYLIEHNSGMTVNANLNLDALPDQKKHIMSHCAQYADLSSDKIRKKLNLLMLGLEYAGITLDILRESYTDLISLKDLTLCPSYGQPAFNAMFQMIKKNNCKKIFNKINFNESETLAAKKYPYILNVNALFDIVHSVGTTMGNSLTVDVDRGFAEKHSRLRNEFRSFLAMNPEHFSYNGKYLLVNEIIHMPNGQIKIEDCYVEIEKKLLNRIRINDPASLIALDYLTRNMQDIIDDTEYIIDQHFMFGLAEHIIRHPRLNKFNLYAHQDDLTQAVSELSANFNFGRNDAEITQRLQHILGETNLMAKITQKDCMSTIPNWN